MRKIFRIYPDGTTARQRLLKKLKLPSMVIGGCFLTLLSIFGGVKCVQAIAAYEKVTSFLIINYDKQGKMEGCFEVAAGRLKGYKRFYIYENADRVYLNNSVNTVTRRIYGLREGHRQETYVQFNLDPKVCTHYEVK